jgi:hypothetical protein
MKASNFISLIKFSTLNSRLLNSRLLNSQLPKSQQMQMAFCAEACAQQLAIPSVYDPAKMKR